MMSWRSLALACAAVVAVCGPAAAYPEFQKFSQANSGRVTDCAMCHRNPDGPEGAAFGQIGSLTPEQLADLGRARAAFEPGQEVNSPILNAFGNHIITTVGKSHVLQFRSHPEELAAALGNESDLDGDGIPDSREFLEGTHPLQKTSGDPWSLFVTNVVRMRFHVGMIVIATVLGMYGLANLLRGAHAVADSENK